MILTAGNEANEGGPNLQLHSKVTTRHSRNQIVLVLERLKPLPEVEASPDFKISGPTRCRPRNAFRIEHEHEKILAKCIDLLGKYLKGRAD